MTKTIKCDICVIGGGSGGLSVAAGATQMGAQTVLIEKGRMGGDCLNYGCVPSKALIAAGKHAHAMTSGEPFGVIPQSPQVDFSRVHNHVHSVIGAIAPHDSVERFEGLGVQVIQETARFTGPKTVQAGYYEIRARRFVIATGSSARVPPIPGLSDVSYFTNETIFDNKTIPGHLITIGAGPIGCELSQAYKRLGAQVSLLDAVKALPKDDPELTTFVLDSLRCDGISIMESVAINKVEKTSEGIRIMCTHQNKEHIIDGSHVLVAAGRKPNIDGLDLEAAGINYTPTGIKVDARLRTTNRRVFAIGDVAGGLQFTHVASYHAGIVIRNALFRLPAKANHDTVPWVTYTDPELAHVGLTEAQANDAGHKNINVLRWPYEENDRARAERATEGLVKVVTGSKGRILGVSIVGTQAGELIQPWVLALTNKLGIRAMAGFISPYPTLGEVNKRIAGSYYTPTLYSPRTKRVVKMLGRLG
ncbi:MAG: FAD-dependent oxidoreductase [Parvularculales bacterium]